MSIIKKNKISKNLNDYSFCLCGESGIGKTSTMVAACEKEFGEDGYVILNMGREQGVDCLEGASYVDIPTWKHFDAAVKEFVKNKDTEYPNLKVVVIDTLDQLIELTEPKVVDDYNKENLGKKDFVPAKTLNGSWGGFGRGEDKVVEYILNKVWELKKVGISTWYCCHVKTREIVDPISNQTYTSLSTLMMQKYFNGFKTKMHVVGVACIDRTIETEKTGRKNVVTKKDITVNRIKEERRKIVFRDDNYSVDSKSRFSGIVDEIPLDADELLKALHDAIKNSKKSTSTTKKTKTTKPAPDPVEEEPAPVEEDVVVDSLPDDYVEDEVDLDADILEEESDYPENLLEEVMKLYKACEDKALKKEVGSVVRTYGKFADVPVSELQQLFDKLNG